MPSSVFSVSVPFAEDPGHAVARCAAKLPDGFETTGRAAVRSERHKIVDVEVRNRGGNVNDCWVVLTSFGMSPSPQLGSSWDAVEESWIEAMA